MTAKPENPPATDTAKAIELLRQNIEVTSRQTGKVLLDLSDYEALIECFAAAVGVQKDLHTVGASCPALDAAIAKVCKGVLNNG